MDVFDQAQEADERFRQQALAGATRPAANAPSHRYCIDCEEPIPEARRKAVPGCQRCKDCQQMHENWRPL